MHTQLRFDLGRGEEKNWIISEVVFDELTLGKCESIMSQGNGYMGLRAATEETYPLEKRDLLVAGTFDRLPDEVPELPNAADPIRMEIIINGEIFHLLKGSMREYRRDLRLRTGELIRSLIWTSPRGDEVEFLFRRFVSLADLHILGQLVSIRPLNRSIHLQLTSSINGQMTNGGSQHFLDIDKRVVKRKILQLVQTTKQSRIPFVHTAAHCFRLNDEPIEPQLNVEIERRRIYGTVQITIPQGDRFTIEKIVHVCTGRDRDLLGFDARQIQELGRELLQEAARTGYESLFQQSAETWEERVWDRYALEVASSDPFDQLALRFALYHLVVMTPRHDEKISVGAKGLSGEAYRGHVFWDTEIYILPFFTLSDPKIARSLLEYRCHSLWAARDKAEKKGYRGAMFPWESADPAEGETTPDYGPADIVTGRATRLWMADHEVHLMGAIPYAIWQYYHATGDEAFMEHHGFQIVFEVADFWQSRVQWSSADDCCHINDVIGPNEFKGHVNDNAYTNYLAKWTMDQALLWCDELRRVRPAIYARLDRRLDLETLEQNLRDKSAKLYLPHPREADKLIAEEFSYLERKEIDLTPYRDNKRPLLSDFSLDQLNDIQVTKQADVILLFYLLPDHFPADVKHANWEFYVPRTLHLSSLSAGIHSLVASDLGRREEAYEFFRRAARIDLGPNMHSSDEGIHAGAMGALWQAAICGFAGVRVTARGLEIDPDLPAGWERLAFPLSWRGCRLAFEITPQRVNVVKLEGAAPQIPLFIYGREQLLEDVLDVYAREEERPAKTAGERAPSVNFEQE